MRKEDDKKIVIAAGTICLACGVFAAKKPEPKAFAVCHGRPKAEADSPR